MQHLFKDMTNIQSRTVQFVGISAFHTRVSDPLIGGTYMTVCVLGFFLNHSGWFLRFC
jgi:PAT family acetyl-CoA transporter-like MFS transporter 1